MFKKTITMVMMVATMVTTPIQVEAHEEDKMDWYRLQALEIETESNLKVVDTEDITYDTLIGRKGTILIERTIGEVLNDEKDGKVLNTDDEYYNYISYKGVDCKKGDIVVTYLLYNPTNDYEDDIIARWDYVIAK